MLTDCFWGHFWPKVALQLSLLSVHLRMYDSNGYGHPYAMQWPLLKSPNFWLSSAEYCIGLLSLGQGHNVARLDTRPPASLRRAVRLETSWPGQWLCYLPAVVSICEYTVSNKGGLACPYHDCGWLWPISYILWGQLPPLPFPPPHQFRCQCCHYMWLVSIRHHRMYYKYDIA